MTETDERILPGQAYVTLLLVWGAHVTSVLIYGVVVKIIEGSVASAPITDLSRGMKLSLLGVALSLIALSNPVRNKLLSYAAAGADRTERAGRVLMANVAAFAFCEASAIIGLIQFFYTHQWSDFLIMASFSLCALVIYFPRRLSWQDWVR